MVDIWRYKPRDINQLCPIFFFIYLSPIVLNPAYVLLFYLSNGQVPKPKQNTQLSLQNRRFFVTYYNKTQWKFTPLIRICKKKKKKKAFYTETIENMLYFFKESLHKRGTQNIIQSYILLHNNFELLCYIIHIKKSYFMNVVSRISIKQCLNGIHVIP